MENKICIKRPLFKNVCLLLFAIFIFVICIIVFVKVPARDNVSVIILFFIAFLCSIQAAKLSIQLIFKYPNILSVDESGFSYYENLVSPGFISWHDVAEIETFNFNNKILIGVKVKNLNDLCNNLPFKKRKIVEVNNSRSGYPILINVISANQNPQAICQKMKMIWQQTIQSTNIEPQNFIIS